MNVAVKFDEAFGMGQGILPQRTPGNAEQRTGGERTEEIRAESKSSKPVSWRECVVDRRRLMVSNLLVFGPGMNAGETRIEYKQMD